MKRAPHHVWGALSFLTAVGLPAQDARLFELADPQCVRVHGGDDLEPGLGNILDEGTPGATFFVGFEHLTGARIDDHTTHGGPPR